MTSGHLLLLSDGSPPRGRHFFSRQGMGVAAAMPHFEWSMPHIHAFSARLLFRAASRAAATSAGFAVRAEKCHRTCRHVKHFGRFRRGMIGHFDANYGALQQDAGTSSIMTYARFVRAAGTGYFSGTIRIGLTLDIARSGDRPSLQEPQRPPRRWPAHIDLGDGALPSDTLARAGRCCAAIQGFSCRAQRPAYSFRRASPPPDFGACAFHYLMRKRRPAHRARHHFASIGAPRCRRCRCLAGRRKRRDISASPCAILYQPALAGLYLLRDMRFRCY